MATAIKLFLSNIWTTLKPTIMLLLSNAGKALIAAAVIAVKNAAANQGFTNAEKRDAAFQAIKAEMVTAGYKVGESAINTAIELALQSFKSDP